MNTTSICVVNGATIQVTNDELQLVPIKPICQALGVNYTTQLEKIQNHPVFGGAVVPLRGITGADGKQYEMKCLPLEYIFGWIFSISPANVSEEARPGLILYQQECNHALYEYFAGKAKRIAEENRAEIECLEEIAGITQSIGEAKSRLAAAKKRLETIRAGRLDPQPILFE